MSVDGVEELI